MKLAIIGTAGRGEDGSKLTVDHWSKMISSSRLAIDLFNKTGRTITSLVSGGAAWADHVAVVIHNNERLPIEIWIPQKRSDFETAMRYHSQFQRVIGGNTWSEVLNCHPNNFKGFKERNTMVASRADMFLAMTFGDKDNVKDGGTKDTVDKMLAEGKDGFHLDLNTMKLYPVVHG